MSTNKTITLILIIIIIALIILMGTVFYLRHTSIHQKELEQKVAELQAQIQESQNQVAEKEKQVLALEIKARNQEAELRALKQQATLTKPKPMTVTPDTSRDELTNRILNLELYVSNIEGVVKKQDEVIQTQAQTIAELKGVNTELKTQIEHYRAIQDIQADIMASLKRGQRQKLISAVVVGVAGGVIVGSLLK